MAQFEMEQFLQALDGNISPVSVNIGGKQCQVKRATAPQVFLILELLKTVSKTMRLSTFEDLQTISQFFEKPSEFLEVMSSAWPRLLDVVIALCSIPKEEVHALDLDELLLLAWAEWKVNERFFMTRVMPTLQKIGTSAQSPEQVVN